MRALLKGPFEVFNGDYGNGSLAAAFGVEMKGSGKVLGGGLVRRGHK